MILCIAKQKISFGTHWFSLLSLIDENAINFLNFLNTHASVRKCDMRAFIRHTIGHPDSRLALHYIISHTQGRSYNQNVQNNIKLKKLCVEQRNLPCNSNYSLFFEYQLLLLVQAKQESWSGGKGLFSTWQTSLLFRELHW